MLQTMFFIINFSRIPNRPNRLTRDEKENIEIKYWTPHSFLRASQSGVTTPTKRNATQDVGKKKRQAQVPKAQKYINSIP